MEGVGVGGGAVYSTLAVGAGCYVLEGVEVGGGEGDSIPVIETGCDGGEVVVRGRADVDSFIVIGAVDIFEVGVACIINQEFVVLVCVRTNDCYVCYI